MITVAVPTKAGVRVRRWQSPVLKTEELGPGVSPKTALSVGLKVDADAIPSAACGQDQGRPEIEALG
jgi:hypothetical protein